MIYFCRCLLEQLIKLVSMSFMFFLLILFSQSGLEPKSIGTPSSCYDFSHFSSGVSTIATDGRLIFDLQLSCARKNSSHYFSLNRWRQVVIASLTKVDAALEPTDKFSKLKQLKGKKNQQQQIRFLNYLI